jgi:hypothetical protein
MKWWAWAATAAVAIVVVVLLAGKDDMRRFRRMKQL